MVEDRLRLSVVIPTFNGLAWLRRCLPRVLRYAPSGTEVIVVDDGSDDGTARWIRSSGHAVRYIRRRTNGGFCAAVNDGILAARAPLVETLNNDALVTPGWADRPLELLSDPDVGAVAPLVLQLDRLGIVDSAGDGWHICGRAYSRFNNEPSMGDVLSGAEVFGVSACAAFYRREALLRAGLFPLRFGAYYDDVDLSFRMRYLGYRLLYCPQSVVLHAVHASYGALTGSRLRRLARNEEWTFWRNTPRSLLPLALPMHVAYVFFHALSMAARPRQAWAYLIGRLEALKEWGEVAEARARLPVRVPRAELAGRLKVDCSVLSFLEHVVRAAWRRAARPRVASRGAEHGYQRRQAA